MKTIKKTAFLIAFLISMGCTNQTRKETPVKKTTSYGDLYVEQKHYYLGEFPKGEKDSVEFRFVLKNSNNSLITINKIDISCSCLKIKTNVREIHPQDSILLEGKMGLKGLNGHISKPIFVKYAYDKTLLLRVICDIK